MNRNFVNILMKFNFSSRTFMAHKTQVIQKHRKLEIVLKNIQKNLKTNKLVVGRKSSKEQHTIISISYVSNKMIQRRTI